MCAILIFAVLSFHTADSGRQLLGPRGALVAVLALGLSIPVAIRRRVPLRSLVIVLAGCLFTLVVGGQLTRGPFLPLTLVLFVVASTCRRGIALAGLGAGLSLLIAQGVVLHFQGLGSGNATGDALVLTIAWMIGYLVQQRRTHLAHVRDRAASDAVTRERLRIARELHDVVAHSMTVVAVQAGFGEYVFDSQPGEARAALGAIQAVSREALGEMQRMLCVLRQTDNDIAAAETNLPGAGAEADGSDPDASDADGSGGEPSGSAAQQSPAAAGPAVNGTAVAGRNRPARLRPTAPLTPAPGLANLDRLVQRTGGAGVTVTVERIGAVRSLPAGLDLSAYRIVQEALTNVVKHSGADRCHVLLEYSRDSLLVEITDPGPGVGAELRALAGAGVRSGALGSGPERAGHGIIGMRERVSLCGGVLHALPRPEGGFVVRARLPLRAERL